MKKLVLVLVVLALVMGHTAQAQYQGDGPYLGYQVPDTATIDSSYSDSSWENVATVIATLADSGYFIVGVSFSVELSKYEQVYWGVTNDSSKDVPTFDTSQTGVNYDKNPRRFLVTDWWIDSTQISVAGGAVDTFFLWMSTGDDVSNILIENLKMKVDPVPYDSGA